MEQSKRFVERAAPVGATPVKLIVRPGKGHGRGDFWKSREDIDAFVDWFDQHPETGDRSDRSPSVTSVTGFGGFQMSPEASV